MPDGRKPLIGRPIANKHIYILNDQFQPVARGEQGQICIGGVGIGRYHRRHDLNAAKFPRDLFSKHTRARLYLTGDVGRWTQDGSLEYLGRQDHQVKIRGQRIELEGVEQVLARAPGVQACAVVFREGRLVAYLVPHSTQPSPEEQVRAYLQRYLTPAMLPSVFVTLDALPRNVNTKVDRHALAALPAPAPAPLSTTSTVIQAAKDSSAEQPRHQPRMRSPRSSCRSARERWSSTP